jgi:hypothetical protein
LLEQTKLLKSFTFSFTTTCQQIIIKSIIPMGACHNRKSRGDEEIFDSSINWAEKPNFDSKKSLRPPRSVRPLPKKVSFRLYHGTSIDFAKLILRDRLRAGSRPGQLGRGVYAAREDKAEGFSKSYNSNQRGGVVFRVIITLQNPLYKAHSRDVGDWQAKGHDGVRVEDTTCSQKMEWCVREESMEIEKWRYTDENTWREPNQSPDEEHYAPRPESHPPRSKYDYLSYPPSVNKYSLVRRDQGFERYTR